MFDKEKQSKWRVTNDDVMGGLSTSKMMLDENGVAVFSGEVSTKNNGGFAMTRMRVNVVLDTEKENIVLKIKGDGKKYQLRVKANRRDRFWYIQHFQTTGEKQEVVLPLSRFYPSFRGYRLNLENFSSNRIEEIAILIGNKTDEKFKLQVEKISVR
ncbi:CIA30 family protein [Tenacibaculum sp. 190130A14a]